jgi:two-component system, OmpR family, response regulator
METTMTLESLANELAKLLADFIHSLVSRKLEKMADRIRGSSLRCDGPLAIVELGSSGEPLARLLTVLNETVLRVGSLELNLIDRVAKRGDRRSDLRPLPAANSNFRTLRKGELL